MKDIEATNPSINRPKTLTETQNSVLNYAAGFCGANIYAGYRVVHFLEM